MKYINSLVLAIPLLFSMVSTDFSEVNITNTHKGVYYDNFVYTDNVIFNGSKGLNIDYTASLEKVGDYYEISFEVINDSKVDVEISKCSYHKDDSYIDYELTYGNGKKINKGDILKKGQKRQLKYRVQYKNPIEEDSYQFDSSFSIGYEQVL